MNRATVMHKWRPKVAEVVAIAHSEIDKATPSEKVSRSDSLHKWWNSLSLAERETAWAFMSMPEAESHPNP